MCDHIHRFTPAKDSGTVELRGENIGPANAAEVLVFDVRRRGRVNYGDASGRFRLFVDECIVKKSGRSASP